MQEIATTALVRRPDARSLNEAAVTSLVDSIALIGIINPIRVRPAGDRFEISAGCHRHEAATRLGLVNVPCMVVSDDDLHAELAMIDENLMRAELGPSDRAYQTARRKEIYEELHPETRVGAFNQHTAAARQVGDEQIERFSSEVSSATGRSERAVQRDAERGEKVAAEVIDMVRGTKLDTGAFLDQMKALPPREQIVATKRAISVLNEEAAAGVDKAKQTKIDTDIRNRAAQELVEFLAPLMPSESWDFFRGSLEAAGNVKLILATFNNHVGNSVMDRRHG